MSHLKRILTCCLCALLASGCATLPHYEGGEQDICHEAELQAKRDTGALGWGVGGFFGVVTFIPIIPLAVAATANNKAPAQQMAPYTGADQKVYGDCYAAAQTGKRERAVWKGWGIFYAVELVLGLTFIAVTHGSLII